MTTPEEAKTALEQGLKVKCEAFIEARDGGRRTCKRNAVTVNKTGAFVYSCRQHEYARCD